MVKHKTVGEIRRSFLDYFQKNGHEIVNSAPLVPFDDASLMFVNAGMVQFKNYFTGMETPKFKRAVSAQKCVRAGGKHNDLENVGYTARHHTFFEMLGNFSFGDYFKEEAIFYAWEFITKELELSKDKLIVTIYHNDDEAFSLWRKISNLPEEKIIRIATNDNFWSMGDTGPCGPCSEVFYDHGDKMSGSLPGQGDEGDRYIEIWNLVFMQYNKLADGSMEKLPNPAIDTGMGLERMAAIMQGKHNNFDIGLFSEIIQKSQEITGVNSDELLVSHRVIADHLRSIAFLIADGVLPLNEGRGYVLRRIMRRAMRHVHQLGYKKPLLTDLFPILLNKMGEHYGELHKAKDLITDTLANEEGKFGKTLDKGLALLKEELSQCEKDTKLSGEIVFKLYDTYGFPVDLTADIIKDYSLEIDYEEFDRLMQEQKERGKLNWQGSGGYQDDNIWFALNEELGDVAFVGYDKSIMSSEVIAICDKQGEKIDIIDNKQQDYFVITRETPFYAESGGQIGDKGIIKNDEGEFIVGDTRKIGNSLIIHVGRLKSGVIKVKNEVLLSIDEIRRQKIKANHSATHILHTVLQDILGEHVSQRGSYVGDDILRFDFTHNKAVSKEEVIRIEKMINSIIRQNSLVKTDVTSVEDAKKSGAKALFGEKYGDVVRVLSMGENQDGSVFSQELCGGTHVNRVGDIGCFKIISEGSIASGIRRIEAITGEACLEYIQLQEEILGNVANILKSSKLDIENNVQNLLNNKKILEKEISHIKQKLSLNIDPKEILEVNNIKVLMKQVEDLNVKDARELALKLRNDFPIVIMLIVAGEKVGVIVAVDTKVMANIDAVEIIKNIVPIIGGKGGGGKKDFAQGGGNQPQNIPQIKEWLSKMILEPV